jgi:hypothetical protein
MNLPWPAALIAFFIAAALTWIEFRTSKYPNTGFLNVGAVPFGFIALFTA